MTKYFKGLDTLRAIAALIVVFQHVEELKNTFGIPNLYAGNSPILPDGHIAVILFFVLSGFLITYLLIKEREKSGQISLKDFYMRRVLRIWPLYYLIILLSYFIVHTDVSAKTIALCLTIFPNVAYALGEGWTSSPQLWSIGVEEQFYLFWPIILIILPEKKVIQSLIFFFIGYSILQHLVGFINVRTWNNEPLGLFMNRLFYGTKFNCMALGCMLGYALAKDKSWIRYITKDVILVSAILLSTALWFFRFEMKYFTDELYAVLFSIVIIGVVRNGRINIDTKLSRFLGKISYGIYMYHWIVLILMFRWIKYDGNQILFNTAIYLSSFVGTILLAWVSYNTIERYFLNLKKKFETK